MKLKELLNEITNISKEESISQPFICGGAVRDKYMGTLSNLNDIDLTTGDKTGKILSEKLFNKLQEKYNVSRKILPDHSSITIGNIKLDFSSNYIIPGVDKFLLKKNIKPSMLKQELFSRDFTCNALLMDFKLENILDFTDQGKKDIDNKIIRTCLYPHVTLVHSKNRVVRAIYMAIKLGFDIDPKIIEFVKSKPESIQMGNAGTIREKLIYCFDKDADKTKYWLNKMNLSKIIEVYGEPNV